MKNRLFFLGVVAVMGIAALFAWDGKRTVDSGVPGLNEQAHLSDTLPLKTVNTEEGLAGGVQNEDQRKSASDSFASYVMAGETDEDANHAINIQRIIVYYIHGNIRCTTCLNMESYTAEVLNREFKQELEKGYLLWKAVNVDLPSNSRLLEKFDNAPNQSVIFVEESNGKTIRWKRLEHCWDFVQDRLTYESYIEENLREFMMDSKT